jgi:hypothetical protein
MGTWDVGPFDNDTAADFGGDLDEAAAGEREGIVRGALTRVIDTVDYLEAPESEVAVSAAALAAAQCPGGEPADPVYGPEELLPDLSGLRDLARQALDRVMTEPSERGKGGRLMGTQPALRLLPWLSPDGKPCFLADAGESGYVSRLADETEALRLGEGLEVLIRARRLLSDPLTPNAEIRHAAIRLSECLADVLRVAESRGRRLSVADDRNGDRGARSGARAACSGPSATPRATNGSPGPPRRTIVVDALHRRSTKE